MQKMQSDLWPHSHGRRKHLQGSVSLCSRPQDSLGTGNKGVITLDNGILSLTVGCCGPDLCLVCIVVVTMLTLHTLPAISVPRLREISLGWDLIVV